MKIALLLFVTLIAKPVGASTEVTLLHFADYHSHALPFYSEGRAQQGGIARAIGYLRNEETHGALVFSGGDMINKGSPAWSDKYRCVEWSWLNDVVAAMAFGNHDADYGADAFRRCAASARYTILSANVVDEKGKLFFRPYKVMQRNGVRIGVFAIAGPDFDTLVKADQRPAAGVRFTDRLAAARDVVKRLREEEHVDAVVMIGHEHHDDDFELARKVPGIDVIFGTHSHRKDELLQIPGTTTWFISPFQYLTYVSRIVMTFEGHRLARVSGGLVPVDASMPEDHDVALRVATLQHEL
ncbi:MAG: bifunctional metallophosphatase/5'-nucleotidase, partial [Thermoanaerobaculia bacterium]